MDILNTVKEVNKKRFALEKHPARELDLEQKIYYLYGLALLMNVDDEIHKKEKEYLATLISLFELPNEKLNEFVVFAKNPNKKIIFEMPEFFTNDVFKYVFIMDCIFLAYKDGLLKDTEKELIYEYGKLLKVNKTNINLLFNLFKKIKKRNPEDISKIKLKGGTINISIFQYLFDYYDLNSKSLKKKNTKDVIEELINQIKFQKEYLTSILYGRDVDDAYEEDIYISETSVTNKFYILFLQSLFDNKDIFINKNIVKTKKGEKLIDISMSSIGFSDGVFECQNNDYVTGLTINGALKFIEWLNNNSKEKYILPEFIAFQEETPKDEDLIRIGYPIYGFFVLYNGSRYINDLVFEKLRNIYVIIKKNEGLKTFFEPKTGIKDYNKILEGATFKLQKK